VKKVPHFTSSDILATNYCEIILDRDNKKDNRDKSNQREDNIFSSVMTLIKATHLEVEENNAFLKKEIKAVDDSSKYENEVAENIELFYPVIVFEGHMYEAKFDNEEISLNRIQYVVFTLITTQAITMEITLSML
jgi:hypothetical protein